MVLIGNQLTHETNRLGADWYNKKDPGILYIMRILHKLWTIYNQIPDKRHALLEDKKRRRCAKMTPTPGLFHVSWGNWVYLYTMRVPIQGNLPPTPDFNSTHFTYLMKDRWRGIYQAFCSRKQKIWKELIALLWFSGVF